MWGWAVLLLLQPERDLLPHSTSQSESEDSLTCVATIHWEIHSGLMKILLLLLSLGNTTQHNIWIGFYHSAMTWSIKHLEKGRRVISNEKAVDKGYLLPDHNCVANLCLHWAWQFFGMGTGFSQLVVGELIEFAVRMGEIETGEESKHVRWVDLDVCRPTAVPHLIIFQDCLLVDVEATSLPWSLLHLITLLPCMYSLQLRWTTALICDSTCTRKKWHLLELGYIHQTNDMQAIQV